jgi:hypothetical protein
VGFFVFLLFPMCSHQAHKGFLPKFPIATQFYPICFARSCHLFI